MTSIELLKIGLQLATFLGMVIVGLGGIWAFKKITENHLAHVDQDLKKIIVSVDKNKENINILNVSVAKIEGRLEKKV